MKFTIIFWTHGTQKFICTPTKLLLSSVDHPYLTSCLLFVSFYRYHFSYWYFLIQTLKLSSDYYASLNFFSHFSSQPCYFLVDETILPTVDRPPEASPGCPLRPKNHRTLIHIAVDVFRQNVVPILRESPSLSSVKLKDAIPFFGPAYTIR